MTVVARFPSGPSSPRDKGPAKRATLRHLQHYLVGRATLLIGIGISFAPVLLLGNAAGAMTRSASATHPKIHMVGQDYNLKLPPASLGCHGATALPGGGEKLPLTVTTEGGNTGATINVCLEGHGPFPFLLDSGAAQTHIDAGLAHHLHLATISSSTGVGIGGCLLHSSDVMLSSWSVDGVPLASQQVAADTEPGMGGQGEYDGLLGNDVLARFGAVRIDFAPGALVLPGPEGPPLTTAAFTGPKGPPPVALTEGHGVVVPAQTSTGVTGNYLSVAVRFGQAPPNWFVVHVGTSRTEIDPWAAKQASLKGTNLVEKGTTACSVNTTPIVQTGPWSVSGLVLQPQLMDWVNIDDPSAAGILGADAMARQRWIVLDYTGGLVVLGP